MQNKKAKSKKVIGIVIIIALIAVFALVYTKFSEKPVEGSKTITIEVINPAEESTTYELKTDAQFLQQAMDEAEGLTYEGTDSEYGLMINTVNGETADFNTDGAYWSFYVNGEYCNYGISEQPVEDGDAFQIIYTAE